MIAGIRLRAGKAGSGKGAASMVAEAISTARAAGATGQILVRGDSAYGNSAVVGACVKAGVAVLGGADQEPGRDAGRSAPSPTTRGPRCTTRARCSTRTPAS